MVAKFLDDNKQKTSLKIKLIDLIQLHLICQMLVTFSGVDPKGTYLSLEKEKENICVLFTYSMKGAREIRKFHVVVVQ